MKNHYETLSISPAATPEQIKTAYTNAVLKIQGQSNFAPRFTEIQQAYDILSNPLSRKKFDAELLSFYTGKFIDHNTTTTQPNKPKEEAKRRVPPPQPKKMNPLLKDIGGILIIIVGLAFLGMLFKNCNNNKPDEVVADTPQQSRDLTPNHFGGNKTKHNGNVPSTDYPSNTDKTSYVDPITQDSINLVNQGYELRYFKNGAEPDCFNYTPQKSGINNKLIVDVGYGTDVVVKLISKRTERCIRYFYVNGGSSYTIRGIPQGLYYLKLAYGKQWMMSTEGGQCKGKFLRGAKYQIGDETLDYNFQYSGDGYSIPSFHLKLGVSYNFDKSDNFRSDDINEEQFNN